MNKQVITFLSLFSLVLVLSVYYVAVPMNVNDESVNDNVSEDNSEITLLDAPSLFFQTLIENRTSRHEEYKNTQMEILVSSEYTNEEKIEAREKLNKEELLETTEKGLEKSISELDFNETFVEKLDNYFYVTIYDGSLTNEMDIKNVCMVIDSFNDYFVNNNVSEFTEYNPVVNFVTF